MKHDVATLTFHRLSGNIGKERSWEAKRCCPSWEAVNKKKGPKQHCITSAKEGPDFPLSHIKKRDEKGFFVRKLSASTSPKNRTWVLSGRSLLKGILGVDLSGR